MSKNYISTGDQSTTAGTGVLTLLNILPVSCAFTILGNCKEGDNILCNLHSNDGYTWELCDCTISILNSTLTITYCRDSSNSKQLIDFGGQTINIIVQQPNDAFVFIGTPPPNAAIGQMCVTASNVPFIYTGAGWFDLSLQSQFDDDRSKILLLTQTFQENDLLISSDDLINLL
jgi:hypothetical protein